MFIVTGLVSLSFIKLPFVVKTFGAYFGVAVLDRFYCIRRRLEFKSKSLVIEKLRNLVRLNTPAWASIEDFCQDFCVYVILGI